MLRLRRSLMINRGTRMNLTLSMPRSRSTNHNLPKSPRNIVPNWTQLESLNNTWTRRWSKSFIKYSRNRHHSLSTSLRWQTASYLFLEEWVIALQETSNFISRITLNWNTSWKSSSQKRSLNLLRPRSLRGFLPYIRISLLMEKLISTLTRSSATCLHGPNTSATFVILLEVWSSSRNPLRMTRAKRPNWWKVSRFMRRVLTTSQYSNLIIWNKKLRWSKGTSQKIRQQGTRRFSRCKKTMLNTRTNSSPKSTLSNPRVFLSRVFNDWRNCWGMKFSLFRRDKWEITRINQTFLFWIKIF